MQWLDAFFARMSRTVLAEQGMVEELLGDGVLAAFGAPLPIDRPCDAARRAARRMQRALEGLQRRRQILPGLMLQLGIGIHHGTVACGALGGRTRKAYKVLGDTVDAAQRIERFTKTTGCPILLSGAVHEQLLPQQRSETHPLGRFAIEGRAAAIELFAARPEARV